MVPAFPAIVAVFFDDDRADTRKFCRRSGVKVGEKLATVDDRRLRFLQPGRQSKSRLQAVNLSQNVQDIDGNSEVAYGGNQIALAIKQADSAGHVSFGEFLQDGVPQTLGSASP